MSKTDRLTSQLQSTLANHADTMSLLPYYDEIASKLRELDSMIQERISALDHEVDGAAASQSDDEMVMNSLSASQPQQLAPETSVPAKKTNRQTGPYPGPTPEEIARFQERPEPLQIISIQRATEIDAKAKATARPEPKPKPKGKQKPTRDSRLRKIWKQ
ncbi:hypothetical protein IL306_002358 [Fusarium sp. DS 682]|nr:hypothetical protein IL306_002358 [Fusarium sp. DS 682]